MIQLVCLASLCLGSPVSSFSTLRFQAGCYAYLAFMQVLNILTLILIFTLHVLCLLNHNPSPLLKWFQQPDTHHATAQISLLSQLPKCWNGSYKWTCLAFSFIGFEKSFTSRICLSTEISILCDFAIKVKEIREFVAETH